MRSSPSRFGLRLHETRAGHDHRELDVAGDATAARDAAACAQVLDPRVRARADEHLVDRDVRHRRVRAASPMYASARSMPSRRVASRSLSGSGTRPSIGTTISGDVPHVTCGAHLRRVEHERRVELGALVAHQRPPMRDGAIPQLAASARAAGRGGSRSSCRPRRSCRRARPPRSTCCTSSSALPSTARGSRSPANSIAWPVPPAVPMRPMIASTRSLAVTPARRRPSTRISIDFAFFITQALRREHVLDFGRADAEGERGERAVRARVRVAADDGHAGQRRALLGADDVHDALAAVAEREVRLGAVLADVGVERLDLRARDRDRGCPRASPWSACCGRRSRRSTPRATACGRRAAGLRTPAGSSPRARGGGRCRSAPCRPALRGRRGCPKLVVERRVPCRGLPPARR